LEWSWAVALASIAVFGASPIGSTDAPSLVFDMI
jgi:hypothetical protein